MTAALNPMPAADLAKASLDRLDAVASAMERKWGIDRLPKLVDAPLALRFRSQAARLARRQMVWDIFDILGRRLWFI